MFSTVSKCLGHAVVHNNDNSRVDLQQQLKMLHVMPVHTYVGIQHII
jgi:hypothetical protein